MSDFFFSNLNVIQNARRLGVRLGPWKHGLHDECSEELECTTPYPVAALHTCVWLQR